MREYDVIIVGAGIVGSSAAYSLSTRTEKKNILLIDQFPVPHTRGSSTGQTRVFRCFYPHHDYGQMCYDSISRWKKLEKETNENLLIQNGYLEIYDKTSPYLRNCVRVSDDLAVPYKHMSAKETEEKYPVFKLPDHFETIDENVGGTLMATKCVLAFQRQFKQNGGTFHDSEKVLQIIPAGNEVFLKTSTGEYKTKSLIITAGSYTQELTKQLGLNLPLKIERTFVCYWKLEDKNKGSLAMGYPTWFYDGVYGLAAHEYPGLMKICDHSGVEIDNINRPDDVQPKIDNVVNLIKNYTTGIEAKPTIIERCLYTFNKTDKMMNTILQMNKHWKKITPDRHFILDKHPKYENIIIGTGFSGTGFKMAPVTGKILADLAMNEKPKYDISRFQLSRFENVLSSKL